MDKETRITLLNGLCIVNFSSRRKLFFQDGLVLQEVSGKRATRLMCVPVETKTEGPKGSTSTLLTYKVTDHLISELDRLEDDASVDYILVPLPIISALATVPREYKKVCRIIMNEDGDISTDKFYR